MRKERSGSRYLRMYTGDGVGISRKETLRGRGCNRKNFSLCRSWLPLREQSGTTAGEAHTAWLWMTVRPHTGTTSQGGAQTSATMNASFWQRSHSGPFTLLVTPPFPGWVGSRCPRRFPYSFPSWALSLDQRSGVTFSLHEKMAESEAVKRLYKLSRLGLIMQWSV